MTNVEKLSSTLVSTGYEDTIYGIDNALNNIKNASARFGDNQIESTEQASFITSISDFVTAVEKEFPAISSRIQESEDTQLSNVLYDAKSSVKNLKHNIKKLKPFVEEIKFEAARDQIRKSVQNLNQLRQSITENNFEDTNMDHDMMLSQLSHNEKVLQNLLRKTSFKDQSMENNLLTMGDSLGSFIRAAQQPGKA